MRQPTNIAHIARAYIGINMGECAQCASLVRIIIYGGAIIRNIRSTSMVIIIISASPWPERPRFEIFVHYGGGCLI